MNSPVCCTIFVVLLKTSTNWDTICHLKKSRRPVAFHTAGLLEDFPRVFVQDTALQAVLSHCTKRRMPVTDPQVTDSRGISMDFPNYKGVFKHDTTSKKWEIDGMVKHPQCHSI